MSFSRPISVPTERRQELNNQCLCPPATIRKLTLLLISHSNRRCKSMFGSFMSGQIGTSDVQRDYSAFQDRLCPVISARCLKMKHLWPKFEANWHNNEAGAWLYARSHFSHWKNYCAA